MALLDVLQNLRVECGVAAHFAASLSRNKPRFSKLRAKLHHGQTFLASLTGTAPTFIELYGRGKIMEAAHGCRRNLNLHGLNALDLRTAKADGSPWNFNLAADRKLARELVETQKPTWLVGSPPCTAFFTAKRALELSTHGSTQGC